MSRPDPPAGPHHSPGRPGPHDPGHGAHDPGHGLHDAGHGRRDPELATILPGITGPGGQFRHRQHINLAFYAVRRYGMPDAVSAICGWIRQIAAYERAPRAGTSPWAPVPPPRTGRSYARPATG